MASYKTTRHKNNDTVIYAEKIFVSISVRIDESHNNPDIHISIRHQNPAQRRQLVSAFLSDLAEGDYIDKTDAQTLTKWYEQL